MIVGACALLVFRADVLSAQLVVRLAPATLSAFEQYVKTVEGSLHERSSGKKPFLQIEADAAGVARVKTGGLEVYAAPGTQPVPVPDGLIHDWTGDVFFPQTTVEKTVALLEDFDRHKQFYPQVADSRVIRRTGNDVVGYWRLQQKGLVPVTFNVEQDTHYEQTAPGKWIGRSYARRIAEIMPGLFARGRAYPLDEGHGYLWRLYAYWSLEARDGGVLGECRTLSLSRDIPPGLAWAVGPFVQKMPQESLESTLRATRDALHGPLNVPAKK